jgi:hypothetical protein
MPAPDKLQPLNGYLSSEAVDINKAGQIVGNSLDVTQSSGAPVVSATLWDGNTISRIVKNNAATESKPTWALRINGDGDVLCKRGGTGIETYFIWKGPASPSIDLSSLPDLPVDLNSNGQVLTSTKSNHHSAGTIYHLSTGHKTVLGTYDPPGDYHWPPQVVGIDHEGRVLAVASPKGGALIADVRYCHPPGSSAWYKVFDPTQTSVQGAILAKNGVVLGHQTGQPGQTTLWDDVFCELEPPLQVVNVSDLYATDADADLIVGGKAPYAEFEKIKPFLYHRSNNSFENLYGHFSSGNWKLPIYAVGVSGNIVIGVGKIGSHTRGWRLDL